MLVSGKLTDLFILRVIGSIARALVEIHAVGLSHQYVNPSNIYVVSEDLVFLRGYGRSYRYKACSCDVVLVAGYQEPLLSNGSLVDLE